MIPNVVICTDECGNRKIDYDVFKFSGGEIQVRLKNNIESFLLKEIKNKSVMLITNITSSDILMEVIMLTDALRRLDVKHISLTTKYFPYARQDRVCYPGEALSLKVICNLINAQNYESVTIWDAHSDVTPALLNNVENIPVESSIRNIFNNNENDYILVSPDNGASKKVINVAKKYKLPMIQAEKIRDTNTGTILSTKVNVPWEHFDKRNFLIVDDICDGGRTFIELAKVLRLQTTGKIDLYVTHGIFSQGYEPFIGWIDHIYVANLLNVEPIPEFVTEV